MKTIFIVKEGQWGLVNPEDYQKQIEFYKSILEAAKDSRGEKKARVKIVATAEEAERRAGMEADVVVFISREMEVAAEKLAKNLPRIKVVVFTGAIPKGKVIWVDKAGTADRKMIQQIVLQW